MSGNSQRWDIMDSMTCRKCRTSNGFILLQIKVKLLFNKGKAKDISNLNVLG